MAGKYRAEIERALNMIGCRIQEQRKRLGWNQSRLAQELSLYGVETQKSSISKWEKGEAVPNAYIFIALCHALRITSGLEVFNADYKPALNEEGLHKLHEYEKDLIATGLYAPPLTVIPSNVIQFREMPFPLQPASAGTGNYLDSTTVEMISFPVDSIPPNADFGMHVSGDSMEPVYPDGSVVWIHECCELSSGDVGVFVYDGCSYIKVYSETYDPESEFQTPVLLSYNKRYDPIVVHPDLSFCIVGKVIRTH